MNIANAATTAAAADVAVPAPIRIADGVYIVPGASGEVEPGNRGRIGNAGFIVGETGVIAIDTGTSYRHGVALLDAIARVTTQPVVLALVTHTRQEFLFGAMAFRERAIPIRMQRRAAGLMRSRCERCLKTLRSTLGDDEMRGTAMFVPDLEFDDAFVTAAIGRPVEVLYFGHSSGPGDIAVFDRRTGTLFAGGLLDAGRVPDVQDAELDGWAAALRALRALPLRQVVGGHGPAGDASLVDGVESYLQALRERIAALLQAGSALSDVPDEAALPAYAGWDQYETIHRRNASVLYVRLERDRMFDRPPAVAR